MFEVWNNPGKENTEKTIKKVIEYSKKRGIKDIIIASNTGETIFKVPQLTDQKEINIVCVTHSCGFRKNGFQELSDENRRILEKKNVKIFTGTHLFRGVERHLQNKYGGAYPDQIIADTLRMFGQGMKVAVEIAVTALDAGLIPYDKEVLSIGGTGRGADTAILIKPEHSHSFFNSKICDILCIAK